MTEPLTKEYVNEILGSKVSVNEEVFTIGYEHNTGRLSLYSQDGKNYIRRLKKGDIIMFEGKIEKLVSRAIKE